MDAKTAITHLKKLEGPPKTLPDWPFSDAILTALFKDPQASARYMQERLNYQFKDKAEIGAHRDAFMELTGLTINNITTIHQTLGLRTLRPLDQQAREQKTLEVRDGRLKILDAVLDAIEGYGSIQTAAHVNDLTYRVVYYLLKKMEKEYKFNFKDLRAVPIPARKALAAKIKKEQRKKIDEDYAALL